MRNDGLNNLKSHFKYFGLEILIKTPLSAVMSEITKNCQVIMILFVYSGIHIFKNCVMLFLCSL